MLGVGEFIVNILHCLAFALDVEDHYFCIFIEDSHKFTVSRELYIHDRRFKDHRLVVHLSLVPTQIEKTQES